MPALLPARLRIAHVLVPAMPGALSAVGILLADTVRDFSRTVMLPGDVVESCGEISSNWSGAELLSLPKRVSKGWRITRWMSAIVGRATN